MINVYGLVLSFVCEGNFQCKPMLSSKLVDVNGNICLARSVVPVGQKYLLVVYGQTAHLCRARNHCNYIRITAGSVCG